jgi:hypothetical protein
MGEAVDVMRRTMAVFNAQAARGLLGRKMKYLFVALMLAGGWRHRRTCPCG